MKNIHIRGGIFSFLFSIVLLAGCGFGSVSPEDTVEKAEKAMDEVESVEIKFKEKQENYTDNGLFKLNLKDDIERYEFENMSMTVYHKDDEILVEDISGEVEQWDDFSYLQNVNDRVEFLTEPFDLLEDFDADFVDHLEVEKNKDKDDIVLTYVGDEEDKDVEQTFAISYIGFYKYGSHYEPMLDAMEKDTKINDVVFEMTLDEEDYLVKSLKVELKYEENDEELKLQHQYTYKRYDDVGKIKALKADGAKKESQDSESSGLLDKFGFGDSDGDVDLDEASAYVDALIQATVFQDAEGFVENAPASMSDDASKDEAELQRDFFKESYTENTKANMEGTGVTDEQIDTLTDAFLKALGKTKYEIIAAESGGDGTAIVTVSIEGIDDAKVYADTDDKLVEMIDAEKVTEDNFIEKNMEVLSSMYEKIETLDAVEVEVTVMKEGNNYMVPIQDEFLLGGFVQ